VAAYQGCVLCLLANHSPLGADVLELFNQVSIPHRANSQEDKTRVGEDDSEEDAQGRQAVESLLVAAVAVLCRARLWPHVCVLQDVAREVRHHKHGSHEATSQGPEFLDAGASPLARAVRDVNVEGKHDRPRNRETNVVAERTSGIRHDPRKEANDGCRPASCADQRRNGQ